ncbi:MAG: hypothetical protein LIO96_14725 [Lachnospiraceae bacterium]|nr:hypothetical protein [Lachnospiraceae bacterium]
MVQERIQDKGITKIHGHMAVLGGDFGELPFRFYGILFPISGNFIIRYTRSRVKGEETSFTAFIDTALPVDNRAKVCGIDRGILAITL